MVNLLLLASGIFLAATVTGMRDFIRWGTVIALFGGFALWLRRFSPHKNIDPYSLGTVSEQWFLDHRHEL